MTYKGYSLTDLSFKGWVVLFGDAWNGAGGAFRIFLGYIMGFVLGVLLGKIYAIIVVFLTENPLLAIPYAIYAFFFKGYSYGCNLVFSCIGVVVAYILDQRGRSVGRDPGKKSFLYLLEMGIVGVLLGSDFGRVVWNYLYRSKHWWEDAPEIGMYLNLGAIVGGSLGAIIAILTLKKELKKRSDKESLPKIQP